MTKTRLSMEQILEALPRSLVVDKDGGQEDAVDGGDGTYTTTTSDASGKVFRHGANGRRYHTFEDDAYFLPNDSVEAGRLDLQHYVWKLSWSGSLHWAPITPGTKRLLDVGTGTGIWPIEVARQYPKLEVVATDLSPIQPDTKPVNCTFLVGNAEHDWHFEEKFDFIHCRMLTMGMHDWPRYFKQCWKNLSPGGWIQTGETRFPQRHADGEPHRESALVRWGQVCYDAALQAGVNSHASDHFNKMLKAQGFVNIQTVEIHWPIGTWAKGKKEKVIGRLTKQNLEKAVPAVSPLLLRLGWKKEDIDKLIGEVMEDVKEGRYYCPMVCHIAQKPKKCWSKLGRGLLRRLPLSAVRNVVIRLKS